MYFDVDLDKNMSYALDVNKYRDLLNDTPKSHIIEDYLLLADDIEYSNNTIRNSLPKPDIDYWMMIILIIVFVCCVMTLIVITIM